jgi:hypothetical protein
MSLSAIVAATWTPDFLPMRPRQRRYSCWRCWYSASSARRVIRCRSCRPKNLVQDLDQPFSVDARKRPYGEPTLRGRAPRLANRAASMPMRTATRPLTNTPCPRAAPPAIRPPCPALQPGQARPTGSLTHQQNRYSSSSSPQARLRRRPPRPKRQLALGLLRRCALQSATASRSTARIGRTFIGCPVEGISR